MEWDSVWILKMFILIFVTTSWTATLINIHNKLLPTHVGQTISHNVSSTLHTFFSFLDPSNWSYKFNLVCTSVFRFFSKTSDEIFLELGMKLEVNSRKIWTSGKNFMKKCFVLYFTLICIFS